MAPTDQWVVLAVTCLFSTVGGQLRWRLIQNDTDSPYVPPPLRDAAIGYDETRDKLVLFGGRGFHTETSTVYADTWIYEVSLEKWRRLDMSTGPVARHSFVAGVNGEFFYISSGEGPNNVQHDDIWRFDLHEETWEKLPIQKRPTYYTTGEWEIRKREALRPGFRYGAAGGIYRNSSRFYLSMGRGEGHIYSDTLSYSTHELGWYIDYPTRCPYNPTYAHARYSHASTMISEHEMLIFGGCLSGGGSAGPCPSADSWIFDARKKVWRQLDECGAARTYGSLAMLPMKNGARRTVLYGGDVSGKQVILTVDLEADEVAILNPDSSRWSSRKTQGDIPTRRMSVAMATGRHGIFMFGGYDIENHRTSNALYFLQGDALSADSAPLAAECSTTFLNLLVLHGVFMAVGWGFCMPCGVFMARYLRHRDPLWFHMHRVVQVCGLILSIAGFVCGAISVQDNHFKFAHGIVGIIAVIIGLQQPINAAICSSRTADGVITSGHCWRFSHHVIGFCVILLAFTNISTGLFLAVAHQAIWKVWFTYMSLVALVFLVAELVKRYRYEPPISDKQTTTKRKYAVNKQGASNGRDLEQCYTNEAICL